MFSGIAESAGEHDVDPVEGNCAAVPSASAVGAPHAYAAEAERLDQRWSLREFPWDLRSWWLMLSISIVWWMMLRNPGCKAENGVTRPQRRPMAA